MLVSVGCTDDVLEKSYSTTADAVADGAVTRGWIPKWVPSAIEINEIHNLDTNESALSFTVENSGAWAPPAACRPAKGQVTEPPFARAWIPSLATLSQDYAIYECPSHVGDSLVEMVAVQHGGGQVLHWRAGAP